MRKPNKNQRREPQANEALEGTLDNIVYSNEETAWSVVRLQVRGRKNLVTAVGNLVGVQPGETLRLSGSWVTDPRFGKQFQASTYMTMQPETLSGIEKYLASGLLPGIGKEMARRLIERFGLDALEIIDKQPGRLTEVEGIGPVRCKRIQSAWTEQRQIKDVMVFLQSHGISTAHAIRIVKAYGDKAISIVNANPYRLAADIFGIGFRTADRIAGDLGIVRDSPRRVEAGVLYALSELRDEGHVYCPRDKLVTMSAELLGVDEDLVQLAIDQLHEARKLVVDGENSEAPIYLGGLHAAESGAAEHLKALLETEPARLKSFDLEHAVSWFERSQQLTLAPGQRDALRRALGPTKGLVITGGPGTGKTTIVNGIVAVLQRHERRLLCCAPTGRAAKRLSETTGYEAKTIHRLLEYSPKSQTFERNADNPLEVDLLIVDEMSMVDVLLLYHLVKALPPEARVVVVGDVDQLPSVGPGTVLRDLIRSGAMDVVVLTEIFRQADESLIVHNAHRINQGQQPRLDQRRAAGSKPTDAELSDFYLIERREPDQILATIKELIVERIPKRFGVDPVDDVQVLTPMHKGTLGATNLNAELQTLLNPDGETFARGSRLYRVGDKVMQTRNNYNLDVFNGDIGRIASIDLGEREAIVRFDGRPVIYSASDLDELTLAYACSIHKSQGSEYPVVVIPLHTQHYAMLQRNLLYTAVTRGRRLVVLVGSRKAVGLAVRNDRVTERYSRLAERLAPDGIITVYPTI